MAWRNRAGTGGQWRALVAVACLALMGEGCGELSSRPAPVEPPPLVATTVQPPATEQSAEPDHSIPAATAPSAPAPPNAAPPNPGLADPPLPNPKPDPLESRADYDRARRELLDADKHFVVDALQAEAASPLERQVAESLKAARGQEIAAYRRDNNFPPARPFYRGVDTIRQSPLFQVLRKMPKGAALHIHSTSAGRASQLVQASRRPECYAEAMAGENATWRLTGRLKFLKPGVAPPENYQPAETLRRLLGADQFDQQLVERVTLGKDDELADDVWQRFNSCFPPLGTALADQEFFDAYFLDAFQTLANDQVRYVELRTGMDTVTDLDGQQRSSIDQFHALRERVRRQIPGFDFKLIISLWRGAPATSEDDVQSGAQQMLAKVRGALEFRRKYPDFVVGFDLVGEEDEGRTTIDLLNVWLAMPALKKEFGIDLPLFFHDGESNWADDDNLLDAYLVGTRRIGHGLNLYLFPALESRLIRHDIPLEVCPISNQILGYVRDLRIHPGTGYWRRGVPMVLSSDDPAIFGYEGLTFDFWIAMMAWELDLLSLKKLALNSIRYSAMSDDEKQVARKQWDADWQDFLREVAAQRR